MTEQTFHCEEVNQNGDCNSCECCRLPSESMVDVWIGNRSGIEQFVDVPSSAVRERIIRSVYSIVNALVLGQLGEWHEYLSVWIRFVSNELK